MATKTGKLSELIRVYQDLERTLKGLKAGGVAAESINMRKLIDRLSKSKRDLEAKIGEALAAEKAHIRKRFARLIKA